MEGVLLMGLPGLVFNVFIFSSDILQIEVAGFMVFWVISLCDMEE